MKKVTSSIIRYESRVTIDRTIEEVFARLADLPSYTTWMHRTGMFRRCDQTSVVEKARARSDPSPRPLSANGLLKPFREVERAGLEPATPSLED